MPGPCPGTGGDKKRSPIRVFPFHPRFRHGRRPRSRLIGLLRQTWGHAATPAAPASAASPPHEIRTAAGEVFRGELIHADATRLVLRSLAAGEITFATAEVVCLPPPFVEAPPPPPSARVKRLQTAACSMPRTVMAGPKKSRPILRLSRSCPPHRVVAALGDQRTVPRRHHRPRASAADKKLVKPRRLRMRCIRPASGSPTPSQNRPYP